MLGLALLASLAWTSGSAGTSGSWVEPQGSLGHLAAFHVRVDLHGSDPDRAALSAEAVKEQMVTTLRSRGVEVVESVPDAPAALHGTGVLVLDVHVLAGEGGTAVAWSLHGSQIARVLSGGWVFASTWEVGDLVHAPAGTAPERLRRSLQPALDEFCQVYLASRPPPVHAPHEPQSPREPERGTNL